MRRSQVVLLAGGDQQFRLDNGQGCVERTVELAEPALGHVQVKAVDHVRQDVPCRADGLLVRAGAEQFLDRLLHAALGQQQPPVPMPQHGHVRCRKFGQAGQEELAEPRVAAHPRAAAQPDDRQVLLTQRRQVRCRRR